MLKVWKLQKLNPEKSSKYYKKSKVINNLDSYSDEDNDDDFN